jgi:hypothetical protein
MATRPAAAGSPADSASLRLGRRAAGYQTQEIIDGRQNFHVGRYEDKTQNFLAFIRLAAVIVLLRHS